MLCCVRWSDMAVIYYPESLISPVFTVKTPWAIPRSAGIWLAIYKVITSMVRTVFCNIKIRLDKSSPKLENLFSKTLQSNTGELYGNNKTNFIPNVQHN